MLSIQNSKSAQEDHSNPIQALNIDSLKVDLVVIQNTCSEKEDTTSETTSSKSVKESILDSFSLDYDSQMTDKYFVEYTRIEVKHFRDTLLQHMGNVKKSVAKRTRHQRQYDRRVNKRQMQTQESKIDTGKAVDADLVVTESIKTDSTVQDESNMSGNDTDADDADIRPIYDEEPMAEVQLTAECNIFAIGQQHTEQPEIINEGRVDQYPEQCQVKSPMLDSSPDNQTTEYSKQSLESENILLKKTVAQFQKDFSRMEAHCIALELNSKSFFKKHGSGQILNETSNKAKIKKEIDEVNSCAKIQSHKTRNSKKLVNQKSHTQKLGRHIFTRHRFYPNKTSVVYEKTSPRSDLRWKPTGRIFKFVGLRWILTGKLFNSCTSKVDSEPPHGSNVDIPNIHECKQTLDVSAGTSINVQKEQSLDLSASTLCNVNKENLRSSTVTTADASDKRQQQPDSTSSTSTLATSVTADENFDLSLLDSLLTRLVPEAPLWVTTVISAVIQATMQSLLKMARIEEIKKDAKLIETDDQLLVLIKRQVKTELMLEEKFRDLCEEVSNFVKEIEDVVKEVERLSCCKDVAKETVRLFTHEQKHLMYCRCFKFFLCLNKA
ncbi:hypothetical protein Tco_0390587 [Tanacetum coccineum]